MSTENHEHFYLLFDGLLAAAEPGPRSMFGIGLIGMLEDCPGKVPGWVKDTELRSELERMKEQGWPTPIKRT